MANANIYETATYSQLIQDKISRHERLLICGLDCAIKKHPVTRYRSAKEKQKAFRHFLQRSKTALV